MARRKSDTKPGHGKLLDAWEPPQDAGDPVGCLATTFTFSSALFEEECLGRFLGLESDPHEDGAAHLIEWEEKASQVVCAAALVDQHHCQGDRSLRWDLLTVRLPRGVLHAKVSLLCWMNRVRIIVSSANLTDDGCRRNLEVFGVVDYHEGSESPRALMRDMVGFLREVASYADDSATGPQQRVADLLYRVDPLPDNWGKEQDDYRRGQVRLYPVFSGPGRANAFDRLAELWSGNLPPTYAAVVSPFFDKAEGLNEPARQLWGLLRKRGEANVSFHTTAEELPDRDGFLIHAPQSLLEAQPRGRQSVGTAFAKVQLDTNRTLHAKTLWLEDDRWGLYMIGSSNFTSAGFGIGRAPNIEANLAYCVDMRNSAAAKAIDAAFPKNTVLAEDTLQFRPPPEDGEDSLGDEAALPGAFGAATYDVRDEHGFVTLQFAGTPLCDWRLLTEPDDSALFTHEDWAQLGRPELHELDWPTARPPSGFWVAWQDGVHRAWWTVNVLAMSALPPPEELRNLSLEDLITILSSARPLHRVLASVLKRKQRERVDSASGVVLDPHKRVDTSTFLLQRTRRVSWALNMLRERLERPVATEQCLDWRLRGPVGVMALARALGREARSEEETAFLLSELALELARVEPTSGPGCLLPAHVRKALDEAIVELEALVSKSMPKSLRNLEIYVKTVFKKVSK